MIQLPDVLNAWGTPGFNEVLKGAIEQLDAEMLPLQQGLSQSDFTTGANRRAVVLNVTDENGFIHAKTGIFYTGMITGEGCADDPNPGGEVIEYCEVQLDIDKKTAETTVTLLKE